jgi:hypothetical protein
VDREEYREYLKSPEWQRTKRQYRKSYLLQKCAICGDEKVDLHHRTYNRLGFERLTDLIPLCREHHGEVHQFYAEHDYNLWTATALYRKKKNPRAKRRKAHLKRMANKVTALKGTEISDQKSGSKLRFR